MHLLIKNKSIFTVVIFQILFCHSIEAFSENFEIKPGNLNKRLVPYTFLEKIVRTHHDCARECFHFGGQCKAINYHLRSRICELKAKGKADSVDASEYEHALGYVFTDITDWPTLTLSQCSDHDCLEKQKCFPHGNADYGCMDKADCGQAPAVQFANVIAWVTTDGAEATYICDFGYEFEGPFSKVTCKGGTWIENGPIVCVLKDCGPPDATSNGRMSFTATTHGGVVTYTCNYGFHYGSGNLKRTCVDGTWDGLTPTCIRIWECYEWNENDRAVLGDSPTIGEESALCLSYANFAWIIGKDDACTCFQPVY